MKVNNIYIGAFGIIFSKKVFNKAKKNYCYPNIFDYKKFADNDQYFLCSSVDGETIFISSNPNKDYGQLYYGKDEKLINTYFCIKSKDLKLIKNFKEIHKDFIDKLNQIDSVINVSVDFGIINVVDIDIRNNIC